MLLVLLLREESLVALESAECVFRAGCFVSRENGVGPAGRAWDLLREALPRGEYRREDWRLCGQHATWSADQPYRSLEFHEIAHSHGWCLLPWGSDAASLMVALISSDDSTIEQVKLILDQGRCDDLIVSSYTAAEILAHQFRGAVFNHGLAEAGRGIWDRNTCTTAVVLTGEAGELSSTSLPPGAQIIHEDVSEDPDLQLPIRRRWLRVFSEESFSYYSGLWSTEFIAAGDVDESSFYSFLEKSRAGGRDPLRFGLAALRTASWIYLPSTDNLSDSVYINRDPIQTAKLLDDQRLSSAPQFALRCFC